MDMDLQCKPTMTSNKTKRIGYGFYSTIQNHNEIKQNQEDLIGYGSIYKMWNQEDLIGYASISTMKNHNDFKKNQEDLIGYGSGYTMQNQNDFRENQEDLTMHIF